MLRWLTIVLAAALLSTVPLVALAQAPAGKTAGKTAGKAGKPASKSESGAVNAIFECLAAGLPSDWTEAVMVVTLDRPGDETGEVQYLVARGRARVPDERFNPCDFRKPALLLIGSRKQQAEAQRGWTVARLTVRRDGGFGLKYDYPKK